MVNGTFKAFAIFSATASETLRFPFSMSGRYVLSMSAILANFSCERFNAMRCSLTLIPNNSFIGHIGGDDFIAIVPTLNCEDVCKDIIANFDANVVRFFTEDDVEKGYIEVANRKGVIEQFPLTSISIGVVEADVGRFANILEIGEVGAQVKHMAKSVMGSSYAIDRRKK